MARLALALVLTCMLAGCAGRANPHNVHVRYPTAETRRGPQNPPPKLIAPPPAYGNRVVLSESTGNEGGT